MILLYAIEPVTVHAASMFLIVAAGPPCLVLQLIVLYRTKEDENQYMTSSTENVTTSTDFVTIYVDMTGGNSTINAKWEVEILQPHQASRQPCQC